jgi:hypothetical protein
MLKDVEIQIPSMSGNLTQALGSGLMEINMKCDLDMQPWSTAASDTNISWKRPQTNGTKTDYNNIDALVELQNYMGINTAWTWLDLGAPAMQFKARLIEIQPDYSNPSVITLKWREYRHGSAASESYSERYGTSL